MTAKEVLAALKEMGHDNIKDIYTNHGAPVTQYGVKIGDMKKIQKKLKKNYELSLELYDTGISDAQYLAGLIADEKKMTKKDLQHWADGATWYMLNEFTVAWIAAESAYGWELALKWIDSKKRKYTIVRMVYARQHRSDKAGCRPRYKKIKGIAETGGKRNCYCRQPGSLCHEYICNSSRGLCKGAKQ